MCLVELEPLSSISERLEFWQVIKLAALSRASSWGLLVSWNPESNKLQDTTNMDLLSQLLGS